MMAVISEAQPNTTKETLLEVAMGLFAQKGYEGTSIREIIESAGVTRPVVYYYFKNKEDLFCQLVELLFQESEANLRRYYESSSECRGRLTAIIRNSFRKAQEAPDGVRFLMRFYLAPPDTEMRVDKEQFVEKRLALMTQIMDEGIRSGELSDGEPERLAVLFLSLMDMQILAMARGGEQVLSDELADSIVSFFFDGAGALNGEGN